MASLTTFTDEALIALDTLAERATFEEVKENDFNLNIPRYVDTFEPEAPVDLKKVQKEITRLEDELVGVRKEIGRYLKELGL